MTLNNLCCLRKIWNPFLKKANHKSGGSAEGVVDRTTVFYLVTGLKHFDCNRLSADLP